MRIGTVVVFLAAVLAGTLSASGLWAQEEDSAAPALQPATSPADNPVAQPTEVAAPNPEMVAPPSPTPEAPAMGMSTLDMELMMVSGDPIVTTAAKRQQKLSQASGNMIIVTGQELRDQGALTLREALFFSCGIEFEYESTFEVMRLRGIQSSLNNKILVLVNGRRVHVPDWGNFEQHFGNNLDNVKQIEIMRGPASALYGANAFAGVINIVTRDGGEIHGVETRASAGYHDRAPGEVSQYYTVVYGRTLNKTQWTWQAGYWRQLGVDLVNTEKPNNVYEGEQVQMSIKQEDDWTLHAGVQKMQQPYPGYYLYKLEHDFNQQLLFFADIQKFWDINDSARLSAGLQETFYPYREVSRPVYVIGRKKINRLSDLPSDADRLLDESGVEHPLSEAVGGYYVDLIGLQGLSTGSALKDKLSGGSMNEAVAEVQLDWSWPEGNYIIAGMNASNQWAGVDYFNESSVMDMNVAGYLQDEVQILQELSALAGVRYDSNTDFGATLSPRASLLLAPWTQLRFKTLYGSAFRAPTLMERYAATDYGFTMAEGNINLKPEKIEQSEAVVEWDVMDALKLKGSYFYWETSDEIQFIMEYKPLYVYAWDMSLLDPSFPADSGLIYLSALNSQGYPSSISWSNLNSRIGHGFEAESVITPWDFTKLQINYSQFELYSRKKPDHLSWEQGQVRLLNGAMGFRIGQSIGLHLYGHWGHSPRGLAEPQDAVKWINMVRYDASLTGSYARWRITLLVQNLFENNAGFNMATGDYVKGPRVLRLLADYRIEF